MHITSGSSCHEVHAGARVGTRLAEKLVMTESCSNHQHNTAIMKRQRACSGFMWPRRLKRPQHAKSGECKWKINNRINRGKGNRQTSKKQMNKLNIKTADITLTSGKIALHCKLKHILVLVGN